MDESTTVEILVDPSCPWAWLTSRWLAEVARVRPITVRTLLFNLAEINRGQEDEHHRISHAAGEMALRVLVQARREGGEPALDLAYTELGEAWHERAEKLSELGTLERAVAAAELDAGLVNRALGDDSTLEELLAGHREAVEGGAFGVPTVRLAGGPSWFGPIIDTRVTGDEAGQLWDRLQPLLVDLGVFELKRNRPGKADVGRYRRAAAATA